MIIPTRFLSLTLHLITTLSLFWSREPNVLACVSQAATVDSDEYRAKDIQLLIGLSLMLLLLLVEYTGFFSGLSLFNKSVSFLSSLLHITACFLLLLFQAQAWNCDTIWYVVAFCSLVPSLIEVVTDDEGVNVDRERKQLSSPKPTHNGVFIFDKVLTPKRSRDVRGDISPVGSEPPNLPPRRYQEEPILRFVTDDGEFDDLDGEPERDEGFNM